MDVPYDNEHVERAISLPARARTPIRGPKRLLRLRADESLVALVRAGDDVAFEVLYERYVVGILSFCRHMLSSQDEAEDATQQAFVSAHRDMLRDGRELNFKPWLYTIARNRCLSILRARREQPAELSEAAVSTAGLQEEVEKRGELRQLVADVQRLPDEQRAALVLSEVGDLSHAEVAQVIGYEPNAVKGLVFRARSALIERREARDADCDAIREELATAKGGALRRSRLRYHLEACPACTAYLEDVRRQRKLLGVALPAVPTLALHDSVMASAGIGAAASAGIAGGSAGLAGGVAAGGAATATTVGAPLVGGTLAKVAIAGLLVAGSAGVATEVVRDGGKESGSQGAPATAEPGAAGRESDGAAGAGGGSQVSDERSHGARGDERRRRGWERARERSYGRSAAGDPRGKALGRSDEPRLKGQGKANGNSGNAPAQPPKAGGKTKSPSGQGQGGGSGKAPATKQGGGGSKPDVPERAPPETSAAPDAPPGQVKAKTEQ